MVNDKSKLSFWQYQLIRALKKDSLKKNRKIEVNYSNSFVTVPFSVPVPLLEVRLLKNYSTAKMKWYSYRKKWALSKYNVTFNFCRVVLEKIDLQVNKVKAKVKRHGNETYVPVPFQRRKKASNINTVIISLPKS